MKSTPHCVWGGEKGMKIDEGLVGVRVVWYITPILAGLSVGLNLHQRADNWCNDVNTQPHTSSRKAQVWGQTSDVIIKLGEKHRLPPHILSGDGYLRNTVSKSQWREQVSRANAMKERVNGPKWWPHKLFPFQCVHYCGGDGYLECCLVCIHQS